MVTFNKNIKLIVNYVAGPLIMLFLFWIVYGQLHKQPHWRDSLAEIWQAATGKGQWKLYGMFALMGINWGIESLKWQIVMRNIQRLSFFRAYEAVFAGTCIASFTPNRVGEYLGRMLFVDPGKKLLSVAPTILCSMSQTLVTLVLGTLGLYFYSGLPLGAVDGSFVLKATYFTPAIIITAITAALLGLLYFRFDPLVSLVNQWLIKHQRKITLPQDFRLPTLTGILVLSLIRYGIFTLQYFLLFSLVGIPLTGLQVFTGVSVMFVLMAVVPTLTFLTDLGFRWTAGIYIFTVFTKNITGILAVSLGIWLINLIIPALIGSLLILRIKLFPTR
jgi:hypothetical protein